MIIRKKITNSNSKNKPKSKIKNQKKSKNTKKFEEILDDIKNQNHIDLLPQV